MHALRLAALSSSALLALMVGCAETAVVSNGTSKQMQFFGTGGVTGHNNVVTVQPFSRLNKFSVIGDGNEIIISDNVTCARVEIWGANNIVRIPRGLLVGFNDFGNNNQLVEEDRGAAAGNTLNRPPNSFGSRFGNDPYSSGQADPYRTGQSDPYGNDPNRSSDPYGSEPAPASSSYGTGGVSARPSDVPPPALADDPSSSPIDDEPLFEDEPLLEPALIEEPEPAVK